MFLTIDDYSFIKHLKLFGSDMTNIIKKMDAELEDKFLKGYSWGIVNFTRKEYEQIFDAIPTKDDWKDSIRKWWLIEISPAEKRKYTMFGKKIKKLISMFESIDPNF